MKFGQLTEHKCFSRKITEIMVGKLVLDAFMKS